MEIQQINTESYWSVEHFLGMLVLPDSPSALFLVVWLLWSFPTAPHLDLWCFGWVWLLCWAGELLCLLLFWGQVQLSPCLLPIKVNGTLETLFCWLRSWWATGTVKCKYLMSSGKQLFYLPQGTFASETGSSLSNSLDVPLKRTFQLGSENLPSLLDFISGESWYYCFSLVWEEVWLEVHISHRFRATVSQSA